MSRRSDARVARDALAQLRRIAAEAAQATTPAEAPAHPDAELLGLCERVLENRRRERALADLRERTCRRGLLWIDPSDEVRQSWTAELLEISAESTRLFRRAGKLQAQTVAGIYAKCRMHEASVAGAPGLAMSVVRDLIRLRPLVWRPEAVL
jgi:hypothetical protein